MRDRTWTLSTVINPLGERSSEQCINQCLYSGYVAYANRAISGKPERNSEQVYNAHYFFKPSLNEWVCECTNVRYSAGLYTTQADFAECNDDTLYR